MTNNFVIGIQCFAKIDTLITLLSSLEKCIGVDKYVLVLFFDSCKNAPLNNIEQWLSYNQIVKNYIYTYKETNSYKYKEIIILETITNAGPYKGAELLIDNCFSYSDYVIFCEDDSVLAKDYLLFYEKLFDQYILSSKNVFGGSAISVGENTNLDDWRLIEKAEWINCTEFAISRHIWFKYGYLRGQIIGDRKFAEAVQENNYYCYYPKINRFFKSGINHPLSYSWYHGHRLEENLEPKLITNDLTIHDIEGYSLQCINMT